MPTLANSSNHPSVLCQYIPGLNKYAMCCVEPHFVYTGILLFEGKHVDGSVYSSNFFYILKLYFPSTDTHFIF